MSEPKKLTDAEMAYIRERDEWGYEEDDDGCPSNMPEMHVGDLLQHIDAITAEDAAKHQRLEKLLNRCVQILRVAGYDESLPHSIINQIIAELGSAYEPGNEVSND